MQGCRCDANVIPLAQGLSLQPGEFYSIGRAGARPDADYVHCLSCHLSMRRCVGLLQSARSVTGTVTYGPFLALPSLRGWGLHLCMMVMVLRP